MNRLPDRRVRRLLTALCLVVCGGRATAAEPLPERIDRLIEASLLFPPAPVAGDAEFLRRVSLDLINRIASVDETRAFLQDPAATKRSALIDRLLASPQHARRMANFFDVTLMERRTDKYVTRAEWENWLLQACTDNRPWDQLVRDLLTADGIDPAKRPPAKFTLDREADANALTRDAGRMFFGRDVQCAQCHDHPSINDFEQREYYGLLSFFQRTALVKEASGVYRLGEQTAGDATFQSVFKKETPHPARPWLPSGTEMQAKAVNPSRRAQLAESATAGHNRAFNRNIVNRLWAMMMGRGLFHPVDLDHPDNPPTHPELLDLLADEFVAMKYDVRAFVRVLANTRTYQRSFDPPTDLSVRQTELTARLPALETDAAASVKAEEAASAALKIARKEALTVRDAVDKALADLRTSEAALATLKKASATATATLAATQAQVQLKTDINTALGQSLAPAKVALAKLPTDVDLKLVADKLTAKSAGLTAELQALAKTVQTQSDAVKAANDKVAATEKPVADLAAKVELMDRQAEPILAKYTAARRALHKAAADSADRERRVQLTKSLTGHRAKVGALAAVEKLVGPIPAEVDVARRARREAMNRSNDHQRLLAAAEKDRDALVQSIAALKQTVEQRQTSMTLLASTIEPIDKAATGLKDDELTKAVAVVKTRQAALAAALVASRKQLADREAQQPIAVGKCDLLRQQEPALKEALATASVKVAQLETQHQKPLADLLDAKSKHGTARQDLLERLTACYAIAPLKPLTAEQMHWSIFQATGILASYEAASVAELEKKAPTTPAQKADAAFRATRTIALERDVHTKLAGNLGPYVSLFGGAPGQPQFEFFATADQALFMENGDAIRAWTGPGVTLVQRLMTHKEPAAFAGELYLTVLNRPPTPEETADVAAWLTRRGGPTAVAASELAWALIASAEFRFSH